MHHPTSIVICGPSGSGKSTLLKKLQAENKQNFVFTVSHTTRKPRHGDVDGRDYHFVDRKTMQQMIKNGDFIEHTEFSGNLYGTSKQAIRDALKTGKTVILEVDVEGVKALKSLYSGDSFQPKFIFVKPPSKAKLFERLSKRKTETQEDLTKRLARADEEIQMAESGIVQFDITLVNDDLETTYKELKNFLKV